MDMIHSLYQLFEKYPTISTDTRKISPNSLFFCLKGENFDGNKFAKQALENGATHVISDDPANKDIPQTIIVDNVLKTLQQLALFHRKKLTIPVIGITGTNGKTTTKELIAAILTQKYKTAHTKGNLNNHIGVPLTLLSIKPDDEIAIVEMGANHPGEIEELCDMALPSAGVITNIGKAHLEGFGSIENIIQTKTALYRSVMANNGTIFINIDDPILASHRDYSHCVGYSQTRKDVTHGNVIRQNPYLEIELSGKAIKTNMTGAYNIYNILCAAAVGNYFGISAEMIKCALEEYKPDNNRSQVIAKGSTTLIADYYNANPTSMEAAIRNFASLFGEKKIAILGDMLELGESSEEEHMRIMALCEELAIPCLFVGNEFAKYAKKNPTIFKNVEEFNTKMEIERFLNHIILVKGSRGVKLEETTIVKSILDEKK